MDNRDERLMGLLEAGGELCDEDVEELINILSQRQLGPDTIGGKQMTLMNTDDPRLLAVMQRRAMAVKRAFQIIKGSAWYKKNCWPKEPEWPASIGKPPSFWSWVDSRIDFIKKVEGLSSR